MKNNLSMDDDLYSRVEKRINAEKKRERQRIKQEQEQEKEEEKNREQIAWQKESKELYEYALWYYYKRHRLYNISLIFAIPGMVLFSYVFYNILADNIENIKGHADFCYWGSYLLIGLSRSIVTEGWSTWNEFDNIFRLGGWERFKQRFCVFLLCFIFAPIAMIYHFFDYFVTLRKMKDPDPPSRSESNGWEGPEKWGHIDSDGTIYRE